MSDPYSPPLLAIGIDTGGSSSQPVADASLPPMSTSSTAVAARRRLAKARHARRTATVEQIEAQGIKPDLASILVSINAPGQPVKRTKLDDSTARKIFAASPNPPGHTDDLAHKAASLEINSPAAELQTLIPAYILQTFPSAVREQLLAVARLRADQISQSTTQWRAQRMASVATHSAKFDLIGSLSTCTEVIVEVCKYLLPSDVLNLYAISRNFHATISASMQSSVLAWAHAMAPVSSRLFAGPSYARYYSNDPAGRPQDRAYHDLGYLTYHQTQPRPAITDVTVRKIPGLPWLQMVVARETRVRDILATLARMGHRLPPGTSLTLKKLWLVMDTATNAARVKLLRDRNFFTNVDLYLMQMFVVKLNLCFNDPVYGPETDGLTQLMLGQRGLSPLWALLRRKRFTERQEIVELKVRYDVGPSPADLFDGELVQGIPMEKMGVEHFEGWGAGTEHLLRPDELIPLEAVRRNLDFDEYGILERMMWYGHVDLHTGRSLVPSLEEMYMDDFELPAAKRVAEPLTLEDMVNTGCGNVPFEPTMWKPKHAKKARWETLSEEEKEMILKAEKAEIERDRKIDDLLEKSRTARLELGSMIEQFGFMLDGSPVPEKEEVAEDAAPEDDDDSMDVDSNSEANETPEEKQAIQAELDAMARGPEPKSRNLQELHPEFFEDMSEFEAELEAERERERLERGDFSSDSDNDDSMSYEDEDEDPYRDTSPLSGSVTSSFDRDDDIVMRSPRPAPAYATLDEVLLDQADEYDDFDEDHYATFAFDWDGYVNKLYHDNEYSPYDPPLIPRTRGEDRRTRELRAYFRQW